MENSSSSLEPEIERPYWLDVSSTVLYVIVYITAFLGNLLTIIAVVKYEKLHRKSTNILILSLSVADGLLGLNTVPEILGRFYNGADFVSEASCVTYMFLNRASIVGNFSFICLIAIERFISVLFPLKSKIWITVEKVKKVVFAVWILITCQMTLEVVMGGEYVPHVQCQWVKYYYQTTISIMVIQFVGYSAVTFVSYIFIFVKIKLQQARRQNLGTQVTPSGGSSKTTKMMAILMGTYYGFFLPTILNAFLQYDAKVKILVTPFIDVTFYFNAIMNPIIYAWMNKDFNDAFRKLLRMRTGTAGSDIVAITNSKHLSGNSSSSAKY